MKSSPASFELGHITALAFVVVGIRSAIAAGDATRHARRLGMEGIMPANCISRRCTLIAMIAGLTRCNGRSTAVVHTEGDPAIRVWFIEPRDGESVPNPVFVRFGVSGAQVRPPGDMTPGTGHHHLLVDEAPMPPRTYIPFDSKHLHYGVDRNGSMIVGRTVSLSLGRHRLTAQFADGAHLSYGSFASKSIEINVVEIG